MVQKHQSGEIIKQRYKIDRILGKGGVGITYGAIDLETNNTVAIKAVSLKQIDDWKQIELFEREAEILAKLDHPNIPKYLDYFDIESKQDKVFYIVQQQAPGKSLFQLVENGWHATEAEVKQIAERVLSILTYLHSLDPPVIHRDIKPHNLVRSDDSNIFLVDFGAVQNTYYNTLMQGSTVVGTYGYMAAEQFRGKAEPATDLYGLGATILYLLTHRSPAELPQNNLKLDFKSQVNISQAFVEWLEKILEPDPQDRFVSAKQALDKLHKKHSFSSGIKIRRKLTALLVFFAAITGVLSLNTKKQDILIKTSFYQSRLCSSPKLIKNYLEFGSDLNIDLKIKGKSKSFLSCLIAKSDRELFNLIQKRKHQIQNQDIYQTILFYHFVQNNNVLAVEEMIEQGFDVNRSFEKDLKYTKYKEGYFCLNSTPIYEAIFQDNLVMVKILVNNGANINELCQPNKVTGRHQNDLIITPLSQAIYLKRTKIAKFLLESGAKIDYGLIPLTLSKVIRYGSYAGIEELLIVLLQDGWNPRENVYFCRFEYMNDGRSATLFNQPKGGSWKSTHIVKYKSLFHFTQTKKKYKIIDLFNQYANHQTEVNK